MLYVSLKINWLKYPNRFLLQNSPQPPMRTKELINAILSNSPQHTAFLQLFSCRTSKNQRECVGSRRANPPSLPSAVICASSIHPAMKIEVSKTTQIKNFFTSQRATAH